MVRLAAGEVLYTQGEAADAAFLVDSGSVQMSYRTADGRQLPSKRHRAGDIFGASGMVGGDSMRRDSARTYFSRRAPFMSRAAHRLSQTALRRPLRARAASLAPSSIGAVRSDAPLSRRWQRL